MDERKCSCVALRRTHGRYEDTYFRSPAFTVFCLLRLIEAESPLSILPIQDVVRGLIMDLVWSSWLWERIQTSLTGMDRPWIITRCEVGEGYHTIRAPVHSYALMETRSWAIFKSPISIKGNDPPYSIPGYFWCDEIYYTRECPRHSRRHFPMPTIKNKEETTCIIT